MIHCLAKGGLDLIETVSHQGMLAALSAEQECDRAIHGIFRTRDTAAGSDAIQGGARLFSGGGDQHPTVTESFTADLQRVAAIGEGHGRFVSQETGETLPLRLKRGRRSRR